MAQGVVGSAIGVGASLSTTIGGYMTDHFGSRAAFLALGAVALSGFLTMVAAMPETRPADA